MLRRNVLVLHQGALGDFIVTWPLVMGLARAMPQSRLHVVTHSQKGELAGRVLGVESADIESGWSHLFTGGPPSDRAAKLLEGARLVYTFIDAEPFVAGLRTAAPHAEVVPLQPRPMTPTKAHVADFIVEQLSARPTEASFAGAMLKAVRDNGLLSGRTIDPAGAVVIHPGSGSPTKNWAAARFAELAMRLRGLGKSVRIVLGEAERERLTADETASLAAAAEIVQPPTLLGLLDVFAGASAYIGNDSGPSHLAAIIGTPSVVLFTRDPAQWTPLGPRVSVLHEPDLGRLSVDRVQAALATAVKTRPAVVAPPADD